MDIDNIEKIVQAVLATLNAQKSSLLVYPEKETFAEVLKNIDINYEIYNENTNTKECQKLIITNINTTQLYNISVGVGNCELSRLVLDFILKGKEVVILESAIEYKIYQYTGNKNLIALYDKYLETIKSFSVKVLTESEFLFESKGGNKVQSEGEFFFKGNLLTEKEVLKGYSQNNSVINVAKNCLVTSLAKDAARENNLTIVHMEE